jgi:hypothetical protein
MYHVSVSDRLAGVAMREAVLTCFQVSAFSKGEVSLSVRIVYSGYRIKDSTLILDNPLLGGSGCLLCRPATLRYEVSNLYPYPDGRHTLP